MAIDGASANLGPESKAWVEALERKTELLERELELLRGQLRAVTSAR